MAEDSYTPKIGEVYKLREEELEPFTNGNCGKKWARAAAEKKSFFILSSIKKRTLADGTDRLFYELLNLNTGVIVGYDETCNIDTHFLKYFEILENKE